MSGDREAFLAAAAKFVADLAAGRCPHCGGPREPRRVVGRCEYAPCGHRIGQTDARLRRHR